MLISFSMNSKFTLIGVWYVHTHLKSQVASSSLVEVVLVLVLAVAVVLVALTYN